MKTQDDPKDLFKVDTDTPGDDLRFKLLGGICDPTALQAETVRQAQILVDEAVKIWSDDISRGSPSWHPGGLAGGRRMSRC